MENLISIPSFELLKLGCEREPLEEEFIVGPLALKPRL